MRAQKSRNESKPRSEGKAVQRVESNKPDTRARVAARRRSRKHSTPEQQPSAPQRQARPAAAPAARTAPGESLPAGKPLSPTRRQVKRSLASTSDMLQRVRKQARQRGQSSDTVSRVRPRARRVVLHWLASGRIVSALLFLASVVALVHLFISPAFHVQQVQVEGNSVLKNEVVSELSGLQGVPIWFVNRDTTAQRVLQNAYVEDVKISVTLPDRATIKIAERRPEVRWAVGDVQYLVDGSGRVLDIAQEPADPETLVIQDNTNHQLQLKDYIDTDALELARALTLRLPDELGLTPASIGWDIALGVYIKTDTGQTIVFGQMDNLERKLAILHHLRQDGTAFTFLDLRPSNPYYRVEG